VRIFREDRTRLAYGRLIEEQEAKRKVAREARAWEAGEEAHC